MKAATVHQFGMVPSRRAAQLDASACSFLIADDHPPVTMAVNFMIGQVADTAPVATEAFTRSDDLLTACAVSSTRHRFVVLDLVMPGALNRVALVQALLRVAPDLRIVVYTAEESPFLAQAVMLAGAMGFVTKTSPPSELMSALREAIAGRHYVDGRIDLVRAIAHPWFTLTDCERAVLLAFCRGAKAADIVTATGRSYSTVTTHKYNGLNKLGLRDGSDLHGYIYLNGLVHELDANEWSARPAPCGNAAS